MTQVVEYDYGKGKVTLRQIRAAIKAVNAQKSKTEEGTPKKVVHQIRKGTAARSTIRG